VSQPGATRPGRRLRAVHDTRFREFTDSLAQRFSARLQPSDHLRDPDLVGSGGLAQFAVSPRQFSIGPGGISLAEAVLPGST
jgi:hypothetical protein